MCLFSALLKHIQSLSILGIVMKVSFGSHPSFSGGSAWEFFNFRKWLELFSFFSCLPWLVFVFCLPHLIQFITSSTLLRLLVVFLLLFRCHLSLTAKDTKLYHGEKYLVSEAMINSFTWQMNLTVRNLHKSDFASYVCSSENALGKSDTRIRLQGKKKERDRKINFSTFSAH